MAGNSTLIDEGVAKRALQRSGILDPELYRLNIVRFICDVLYSHSCYLADVDVKRVSESKYIERFYG